MGRAAIKPQLEKFSQSIRLAYSNYTFLNHWVAAMETKAAPMPARLVDTGYLPGELTYKR